MSDQERLIKAATGEAPALVDFSPNSELLPNHVQDWLLSHLVILANDYQLEFGITLNIGGAVVSGTMISADNYLEEMAKVIENNAHDTSDDKPTFEKIMANFFRGWRPLYEREAAEQADALSHSPRYIHLRNAHTMIGGATVVPSKDGVLWRGRVAAIDGYSFGSLSFG